MSGMVGQITKTGGTNVPPVIQLKYALPQALLLCSNVNCVLCVFHKFDYCALWPISVARSSYCHRLSSRLSVVCLSVCNAWIVAKRYVLAKKCLKVRIGTCQLRIQRYYRRLPTNNRSREIGEPKIWATLSWRPSTASLVAIRPFAREKKRFAQKFTDGRTDGQATDAARLYKLMEWAKNGGNRFVGS